MNYIITEVFLDESNKYRVRAIINNETRETQFFFFDSYPNQEEVNKAVNQIYSPIIDQASE